jgi:hypothetical protein
MMTTRIKIYAWNEQEAGKLAAKLNLALRHWEYAGKSDLPWDSCWANVGSAMDDLQRMEFQYEQLGG